jgi:hypothetical protein
VNVGYLGGPEKESIPFVYNLEIGWLVEFNGARASKAMLRQTLDYAEHLVKYKTISA